MTIVLHIDCSAKLTTSRSRAKSAQVVEDLSPTEVIRRDLATDPLPFIDTAWINARLVLSDDQTDNDR